MRKPLGLLSLSLGASCASIAPPPSFDATLLGADQYVFRGVPQNERGVLQADISSTLPLENGDALSLGAWANFDGGDRTGDAALPGGSGGSASEIDLLVGYSRTVNHVDLSFGLVNYNFPSVTFASTTEAYLEAGTTLHGVDAVASIYYDIEEVHGLYSRIDLAKSFDVSEDLALDLAAGIGWSDSDHSSAYYGAASSELADAGITLGLSHALDEHRSISVQGAWSSILGSDLSDAIDGAGMDDSNLVTSISMSWSY